MGDNEAVEVAGAEVMAEKLADFVDGSASGGDIVDDDED